MSNWIEKLKVGDQVVVSTNMGRVLRTVDKITPAGNIKLNNGTLYNKDGSQRGNNGWYSNSLEEATPEVIQEIKKAHFIVYARKKIKESLNNLNVDQLREILKIISTDKENNDED